MRLSLTEMLVHGTSCTRGEDLIYELPLLPHVYISKSTYF